MQTNLFILFCFFPLQHKIFVLTTYRGQTSTAPWHCQCKHFQEHYLSSSGIGSQFECLHIELLKGIHDQEGGSALLVTYFAANIADLGQVLLPLDDSDVPVFINTSNDNSETEGDHDEGDNNNEEREQAGCEENNEDAGEENAGNETLNDIYHRIVHTASEDREYEVEAVIGKRQTSSGDIEYLISWKGSTPRWNDWRKKGDMNCDELIEEYERAVSENKIKLIKRPLVRVGDSVLVPHASGETYCWVVKGMNGKLRCRGVHKYPPPTHPPFLHFKYLYIVI